MPTAERGSGIAAGGTIAPHARPAQLVDEGPPRRDPVAPLGRGHRGEHLAPQLGDERPERLLHVLHLLVLVVRPLPVEAQHRYAPLVHGARAELAIRVVVRDHLAAPREADRAAVISAGAAFGWLACARPR